MLPKTYKSLDGCWNCIHVFVYYEYDDGARFYCTQDGEKRPLCGSIAMDEDFGAVLESIGIKIEDKNHDIEYSKLMDDWEKWEKIHGVNESGICDEYVKSKKKE